MKDLESKATPKPAEPKAKTKLEESMEQVLTNKFVAEKWDTDYETPESEKGKYKGKTKAELEKQLAALKKSGPHKKGSKEAETQSELNFALRAKSGWGKVKEDAMDEDLVKSKYGDDGVNYALKDKPEAGPKDTKFDSSSLADVMGGKHPYKKPGKVAHRQQHSWDDEAEEGPGDLDAALKHIPRNVREGDAFKNVNPRVEKPTIAGTDKKAKSGYYPEPKEKVKKLDKPTDKFDKMKESEELDEKAINKYAIGMAAAKKAAGYGKKPAHNLPKSVIRKGHEIAKHVKEATINRLVDNMFESVETIMNSKSEEPLTYEQDQLKQHLGSHLYGKLVKSMKLRDDFPDDLFDNLFHFYRDEMPYGTVNGRTGDPRDWIKDRLNEVFPELDEAINPTRGSSFASQMPSGADIMEPTPAPEFTPSSTQAPAQRPGVLSRAADAIGASANKLMTKMGHPDDETLLKQLSKKSTMESVYKETAETKSLAEMMRLAGLPVAEAKKSDKADKDYDGDGEVESEKDEVQDSHRKAAGLPFKESKDKPDFLDVDGDGDEKESFKKAVDDKEKVDECMDMVGAQQTDSHFSVNSSMDSNGNKTMTISATGEKADELAQMLRLAGQQSAVATQPEVVMSEPAEVGANDDVEAVAVIGDEELDEVSRGEYIKQQDAEAEKSGKDKFNAFGQEFDTDEIEEEKDSRFHASTTPAEHVLPTQALTKGGDGDVAGMEKKMNPTKPTWKNGDNAMSEGMSNKLMREYESIKVTK